MNNPLLSIVCITYNHEKFIRQTLESFVMQKTNFPFEAIIAEDCSPDNTRQIIKEFEEKYPDIIKPIYREKNVGISINANNALQAARGKYIALCEGDDFFSDKNKLQIQVDYLELNPGCTLCFHHVRCFFDDNKHEDVIFPSKRDPALFNVKELLRANFIQTNSVVYRKQNYDSLPVDILPGDWYLHLYHARFGTIGFIDKVMSAYRRHEGGIWADAASNLRQHYKKHGVSQFKMFIEVLKLFSDNEEYRTIILKNVDYLFQSFLEIDRKDCSDLFSLSLNAVPDNLKSIIIEYAFSELVDKVKPINDKTVQLNKILNSRKWKLINRLDMFIPRQIKKVIEKLFF